MSLGRPAIVALLAVIAGCSGGGHGAASPGSSSSSRPDALAVRIVGTWRPVWIAGFADPIPPTPRPATVRFDADGRWVGSDGCNGLGGSYRVDPSGAFSGRLEGMHTQIGCNNVPNEDVLPRATRVEVGDATLTFRSVDDRELARYVRVRSANGA